MMNMWKMKITTIKIVMIPMMMIINNYYLVFNLLRTTSGGNDLTVCKTLINLLS